MAQVRKIKLTNLFLDPENPRLGASPNGGPWTQPSMLEYFAARQDVQALAADIALNGLNPSKRPLALEESRSRLVVLEGNRRQAALRLLAEPNLAGGRHAKIFKDLDRGAQLPEEIECAVVARREDADHWVRMEHGLGKSGTSTLEWGPSEKSRFEARTTGSGAGRYGKSTAIMDTLAASGHLSPQQVNAIPVTTLDRLLNDPEVRRTLSLDFSDLVVNDSNRPGILRIVKDLIAPKDQRVTVDAVKTKEKRRAYVESFATTAKVPASPAPQPPTQMPPATRPRLEKKAWERKTLIPNDFKPRIANRRLREIFSELRALPLDHYSNAASVLFRCFLDIALYEFYERRGWARPGDFRTAVKRSAQALAKEKHLEPGVETVVVRASNDDESFVSVKALHQYVHGPFDFPNAKNLNRLWDSFQPYIDALLKH